MGEIAKQSKNQGATNRTRDLANSISRLGGDSGVQQADTGATAVVITEAVVDGAGRICKGYVNSGGQQGFEFEKIRCDGAVSAGDETIMITTTDGARIQALGTGSASGGATTNNIVVYNTFSSD
jgi:hypothetical protein